MAHYTRALDKLYTKIDMAHMVPKVVQKMRSEYKGHPLDFYLLVCKKYDETPEPFNVDLLVYGKTKFKKHKLEQDADKERVGERKDRETEKKSEEETAIAKAEVTEEESAIAKAEVPEVTDKQEMAVDEETLQPGTEDAEKKGAMPKPIENNDEKLEQVDEPEPEREILAQSPRTAKAIEGMYPQEFRNANNETGSPRTGPTQKIEYVNIYPGDICETMVLTQSDKNQETGFWIPARVLSIDTERERMNLEVLQPAKYGLSRSAQNVPYRYVRAPSEIIWKQ